MSGFDNTRVACLALLNSGLVPNAKTGQFLGGVAYQDGPLTERQERWLSDLLRKAELPPLQIGGEA